jgi:hypothetical protein
MQTWSIFSNSDIFLALLGSIGLGSAIIVIKTAFTNTDRLERNRKNG